MEKTGKGGHERVGSRGGKINASYRSNDNSLSDVASQNSKSPAMAQAKGKGRGRKHNRKRGERIRREG